MMVALGADVLLFIPLSLSLLPAPQELLQYFLGQPLTILMWLRFVNHRLVNCPAALKHVLLQSLFEMESCSCLKDFIIEQYQDDFIHLRGAEQSKNEERLVLALPIQEDVNRRLGWSNQKRHGTTLPLLF